MLSALPAPSRARLLRRKGQLTAGPRFHGSTSALRHMLMTASAYPETYISMAALPPPPPPPPPPSVTTQVASRASSGAAAGPDRPGLYTCGSL